MSKILFAAKHSWTTLRMSRPLFAGSYRSRGGLSANEKEEKFASNDNPFYLLFVTLARFSRLVKPS